MAKFDDIPKVTKTASYRVHQPWAYLEKFLAEMDKDYGLILAPDYQRGHVWTEEQEIRFVEWVLKGGHTGKEIHFNCKGWMQIGDAHPLELVDGKQRLKAVLRFLRNEIPAFGAYRKDYSDRLPMDAHFYVHVNDLETRREVLQWYVDMNAGGTVHSKDEIDRVRDLIEAEGAAAPGANGTKTARRKSETKN